MDNSLGFLREWLPFARDDRTDRVTAALQDWLAGLGQMADFERARLLTERLKQLLAAQDNPLAQAKILAAVDSEAGQLLPPLEMTVAAAPLPLGNDASEAALAADNLLKALAAGHVQVAAQLIERRPAPVISETLGRALENAAATLLRRQLLAYRAYAPASATSWLSFHRIYGIAQTQKAQIHGAFDSVELHYHAALLLALADPMKFSRESLPLLQQLSEGMARHVRLYPTAGHKLPETASLFLVLPSEGRPARPLARNDPQPLDYDGYIVDCNPAVGALRKEIARHELAGGGASGDADLTVMAALLSMWRGHPQRRFSRTRFKPRGELVSGIEDLLAAVGGVALLCRRSQDPIPPGGVKPAVSEWAITDESPDGFGIRFLRGDMRRVEVGDLVAFRPRERGRIHLCLVRRITNAGAAQLELGLQELSPQAQSVAIPAPQAGAAVIQGIYLPKMPGFRNAAGLIVAPGTLTGGQTISVTIGGQPIRMITGRFLQRGERSHLIQVDPAPVF